MMLIIPLIILHYINSPVILWFDLGLVAREGFSNVSYSVLYNILKVLRNSVKGKHIGMSHFTLINVVNSNNM